MKNNFRSVFLLFCLIATLITTTTGQRSASFKNGIRIATKTEATLGDLQAIYIHPLDTWETVGNKAILHRMMVDNKNGLFFGYDIEVVRNVEPNKFNVSIKPMTYKKGSNPEAERFQIEKYTAIPPVKYPDEMVVEYGDLIKLDLLENPVKKLKVTDYIKIFNTSTPFGYAVSFSELKPTRDFTMDDVYLRLENFELLINGKHFINLKDKDFIISGSNLYFAIPQKGRFVISPFPREGYNMQKIGLAIDNKLSFTVNGEKYEIISKSSILGEDGNWNIWVLNDPNYRKSLEFQEKDDSVSFNGGNIEEIFKSFRLLDSFDVPIFPNPKKLP